MTDLIGAATGTATVRVNAGMAAFRGEVATARVGMYATRPLDDYWTPVAFPLNMAAWHNANDALSGIAEECDVLFPSLHTFYDDQIGWVTYATANIAEARRCGGGKKVYPYIWMDYHNSAPDPLPGT
jgi:hypothetical protein